MFWNLIDFPAAEVSCQAVWGGGGTTVKELCQRVKSAIKVLSLTLSSGNKTSNQGVNFDAVKHTICCSM